jgi:HEPN domain-containing protein
MDESGVELVAAWRSKAMHDLDAAHLLAKAAGGHLLDTAAYHCQQAAEKMLKAALCAVEVQVPRTHDLVVLVRECAQHCAAFGDLLPQAALLTPLATLYRYPGLGSPDVQELNEALCAAEQIVSTVAAVLDEGRLKA